MRSWKRFVLFVECWDDKYEVRFLGHNDDGHGGRILLRLTNGDREVEINQSVTGGGWL